MVTTPGRRSSWVRKCGVCVAAAGASSGLIRCSAGTTTARKRVACGRHSHISICSRLPTISKALQRSSLISREYDLMDRTSDLGSFCQYIEAMIPVNWQNGTSVGIIGQLHFFLDDIFPPRCLLERTSLGQAPMSQSGHGLGILLQQLQINPQPNL